MYDLIEKKKKALALTQDEIEYLINGYTNGEIPDYQMSAYLMAVVFNGMTDEETYEFTMAMKNSGDELDLSSIPGLKIDKHSTGGVGDKTTLVLGPLIASLGVPVAKMSGRGLGHTGGTIDKLEAFPGFETAIREETFLNNVKEHGIAVAGQTKNLAPADKKIYALRDITATVDSIPLIASSIMSKKLASGADGICLDVKVGSGAFMKDEKEAEKLATAMVEIGRRAGRKMVAVLTNMDEPLGYAVGNTLEVMEAIDSLKGNGPKDFMELIYALGEQMLMLSDESLTQEAARKMLEDAIASQKAYEMFKTFIQIQGGNPYDVDHIEDLLKASFVEEVKADCDGYVESIQAEEIGRASMIMGGGRATKEDVIDMSVGVVLRKKVGDEVKAGDTIATVYGNKKESVDQAIAMVKEAYGFSKEKVSPKPMILKVIK
jgi:pyrimidine-nucleoside phosphorylase